MLIYLKDGKGLLNYQAQVLPTSMKLPTKDSPNTRTAPSVVPSSHTQAGTTHLSWVQPGTSLAQCKGWQSPARSLGKVLNSAAIQSQGPELSQLPQYSLTVATGLQRQRQPYLEPAQPGEGSGRLLPSRLPADAALLPGQSKQRRNSPGHR